MEIRAIEVYRAMLGQCKADIAGAEPHARGRALVDFADFVLSDASADGATAIRELLETAEIPPWDRTWVVPEMARATLDALNAWQRLAEDVSRRLEGLDDTEAVKELRGRLTEACRVVSDRLNS